MLLASSNWFKQIIIARAFKNTRLFVHRKSAQQDFGEWDI